MSINLFTGRKLMSSFNICVWEINELYTLKLRKTNNYCHIQWKKNYYFGSSLIKKIIFYLFVNIWGLINTLIGTKIYWEKFGGLRRLPTCLMHWANTSSKQNESWRGRKATRIVTKHLYFKTIILKSTRITLESTQK